MQAGYTNLRIDKTCFEIKFKYKFSQIYKD